MTVASEPDSALICTSFLAIIFFRVPDTLSSTRDPKYVHIVIKGRLKVH